MRQRYKVFAEPLRGHGVQGFLSSRDQRHNMLAGLLAASLGVLQGHGSVVWVEVSGGDCREVVDTLPAGQQVEPQGSPSDTLKLRDALPVGAQLGLAEGSLSGL